MGFMTTAQGRGAHPGKKPSATPRSTKTDPSEANHPTSEDDVPYAHEDEAMAIAQRVAVEDAELLRRLAK